MAKKPWGTGDDWATSIQQTMDGGYIVAGYTNSTDGDVTGLHGFYDYWVVKLDASGVLQWQKTLGGNDDDKAYSIQQTADGGYIVAGSANSTDGDVTGIHGYYDLWVVKLNATGLLQWQEALGGNAYDGANQIQQTADGGYIVAGYLGSNDVIGYHGSNDYWAVKLNATGVMQWQKAVGGTYDDKVLSIQQTTDGGYIMAGYTQSFDGDVTGAIGGADYWIVKLAPDNLATTTFEKSNLLIYPNPANNALSVQIENGCTLDKITITDLSGKVILTQTKNTNTINIENLAKGTYFLEAFTGEEKMISKFVKE